MHTAKICHFFVDVRKDGLFEHLTDAAVNGDAPHCWVLRLRGVLLGEKKHTSSGEILRVVVGGEPVVELCSGFW